MDKDLAIYESVPDEFKNSDGSAKKEYIEKVIVEGYKFEPTDEELLAFYLKKKVNGEELPFHVIHEDNVYDYSPEELTGKYELYKTTTEWYFFTKRTAKYLNGKRPDRTAGTTGYWKANGVDRKIRVKGEIIGSKRCLDFFYGLDRKNSKRTNWKMHEYVLAKKNIPPSCKRTRDGKKLLDEYVLCCIYKHDKRRNHQSDDNDEEPEDHNGHQQILGSTLLPQGNDALMATDINRPESSNQGSYFYDNTTTTLKFSNAETGLIHNYENSSSFIVMHPTGLGFLTSNIAEVVDPSANVMDKVNDENNAAFLGAKSYSLGGQNTYIYTGFLEDVNAYRNINETSSCSMQEPKIPNDDAMEKLNGAKHALFNGAKSSSLVEQSSCNSTGLLNDVVNECRKTDGTSVSSVKELENHKGKEVVTSDNVEAKETSGAVIETVEDDLMDKILAEFDSFPRKEQDNMDTDLGDAFWDGLGNITDNI
ncbi:hypothetical protein L6164_016539 [Bauhinia variegata]|uniref:Uncharacterized protein n=1 Tax=Bauhinia variegata TaxID=167791 RepID=A0ACB9NV27_BAUVA|nr:hypothetical protein L6164_016539 [Bauhinia variegata]